MTSTAELEHPLSSNPSFFQRQRAAVVNEILEGESPLSTHEETQRWLPLVDSLTQPRSITEFQHLKQALLDVFWAFWNAGDEGDDFAESTSRVFWELFPRIKIFPWMRLEDPSRCHYQEGVWPDEIWQLHEEVGQRDFHSSREKKMSLPEAIELSELAHEKGRRVGAVFGKFRAGPISEQIQLLEEAKLALGAGSLLVVFVESQKSIEHREGEVGVLGDEERLGQIAGLGAVDYVVLAEPSDEELQDLQGFFYQLKRALNPDVLFMGEANYYLRPLFEKEAKELGMLLLWHKPEIQVSTTDLITELFSRLQEAES